MRVEGLRCGVRAVGWQFFRETVIGVVGGFYLRLERDFIYKLCFGIQLYIRENIIETGITCKQISCYIRNSAGIGLLLKMLKYFEVMMNILKFSHVKENAKS